MVYDDDGVDDSDPADRLLLDFKKKLDDLHDGVGDLLHMRRMATITVGEGEDAYQSDELVNYLHYTLTDEPIALRIPDCPMYLDAWLGYPTLWPGDTPKVGDKFVSCVAIEGFPGILPRHCRRARQSAAVLSLVVAVYLGGVCGRGRNPTLSRERAYRSPLVRHSGRHSDRE